jgi:hypothetical protein
MRTMAIVVMLLVVSGVAGANDKPIVSVAVASSHDESPGDRDPETRDANRETIRVALLDAVSESPQLTSIAQRGVAARRVDLTVVALDVIQGAHSVEIVTQLKVVISDASGKILSIVTGGAKSEVSRRAFSTNPHAVERQLLRDAMQGMFPPLRTHLIASC